MVLYTLGFLTGIIIRLFLLYVGLIYIIGISFWLFSLFTGHSIKLGRILAYPFTKKSQFPKTKTLTKTRRK